MRAPTRAPGRVRGTSTSALPCAAQPRGRSSARFGSLGGGVAPRPLPGRVRPRPARRRAPRSAGWPPRHASPEVLRRARGAAVRGARRPQVALGPVRLGFDRDGIELDRRGAARLPLGRRRRPRGRRASRSRWTSGPRCSARCASGASTSPVRRCASAAAGDGLRPRRRRRGRRSQAEARRARRRASRQGPPWYEALAAALPRLSVTARTGRGRRRGRAPAAISRSRRLDGSLQRRWLRGGVALEARGELARERRRRRDTSASRARPASARASTSTSTSWRSPRWPALRAAPGRAPGTARPGERRARAPREATRDRAAPRRARARRMHLEPRARRRAPHAARPRARAHRRPRRAAARARTRSVAGELDRLGASRVPFEAEVGEHGLARAARSARVDLAALGPLAEALAGARAEPRRAAPSRTLHGGRLERARADARARRERQGAAAARDLADRRAPRSTRAARAALGRALGRGQLRRRRARADAASARVLDGQPLPDARRAARRSRQRPRDLRAALRRAGAGERAARAARPLADWIAGDEGARRARRPGGGSGSRPAWLEHPALLCAVERLRGEVVPDPASRGVQVTLERAVWAGVPIRGTRELSGAARGGSEPARRDRPALRAHPARAPAERLGARALRVRDDLARSLQDARRLGLLPARRAPTCGSTTASLRLDPGPRAAGLRRSRSRGPERVPFELAGRR